MTKLEKQYSLVISNLLSLQLHHKDSDHIMFLFLFQSDPDVDNIGKIEVVPEYGFHAKYFPYTGQVSILTVP